MLPLKPIFSQEIAFTTVVFHLTILGIVVLLPLAALLAPIFVQAQVDFLLEFPHDFQFVYFPMLCFPPYFLIA